MSETETKKRLVNEMVEASVMPLHNEERKVVGTSGISGDIIEQKRAEEALQQREAVLRAIALAAEKLLRATDWEQDIQAVLAYLGQAADVNRILIFEGSTSNNGKYLISGRYEWIAPGAKLTALQSLQNVPMFEQWQDLLPRGEIISGHVRDFGAQEQKFFVPRGVKSVLVVPVFVNNAWWGFMAFELSVTEREWTEAEIDAVKTAASILGGALERKRAEEALEKTRAEVEKQVEERTAELQREIFERGRAEEERERLRQEIIETQQQALQELSTPVIPIMDAPGGAGGIIVMPLIGSIDSMRARNITRSLLAGISQHRAKVVLLDVTGVPLVDSGVANHLNKTIQAARLKGARTIITGVSDAVAEAIVDLGIDWADITTLSDLQTGLVVALGSLGFKLSKG